MMEKKGERESEHGYDNHEKDHVWLMQAERLLSAI